MYADEEKQRGATSLSGNFAQKKPGELALTGQKISD
jgi:hypothetical protein